MEDSVTFSCFENKEKLFNYAYYSLFFIIKRTENIYLNESEMFDEQCNVSKYAKKLSQKIK